MSDDVKVYTTTYCAYCTQAKSLLKRRAIAFEEIDVTHDPEKRAWLVQASGGRRTVPQIFINGESVGGSQEIHELDRHGRLLPLVRGEDRQTGT